MRFEIVNLQFSILASLIFVTTRHSPSKLDSALAATKIQFPSLFPSEVGGDFTPFGGIPFDDGRLDGVGAQPRLGSGDDVVELLGSLRAFQGGLALLLRHP